MTGEERGGMTVVVHRRDFAPIVLGSYSRGQLRVFMRFTGVHKQIKIKMVFCCQDQKKMLS